MAAILSFPVVLLWQAAILDWYDVAYTPVNCKIIFPLLWPWGKVSYKRGYNTIYAFP